MPVAALKEWAEVIGALGAGAQIMVLRKGGIAEEGRDFSPREREFLLYPTYGHQRDELLKPPYRAGIKPALETGEVQESVIIEYYARTTGSYEITSRRQITELSPYYIHEESYMVDRLNWKPRKPLLLLFLRVYRLGGVIRLPVRPEYAGCKSWVDLDPDINRDEMIPVVPDGEYLERVSEISGKLTPEA